MKQPLLFLIFNAIRFEDNRQSAKDQFGQRGKHRRESSAAR